MPHYRKFSTSKISITYYLPRSFLKHTEISWSTYGAGKKGCTGEGEPLLDDSRQYLSLEECQRSCDETSSCNAISWNSRDNRCFLKSKLDSCQDWPCDWGRMDAIDWNFYRKNCRNYFCFLSYSKVQLQ